MKRDLTVERLYFLGDFKNIRFVNTLSDIPERYSEDGKILNLLYYQMCIEVETAYRQYIAATETIANELSVERSGKRVVDNEKAIQFLQEEREKTFEALLKEIENKNRKEMPDKVN